MRNIVNHYVPTNPKLVLFYFRVIIKDTAAPTLTVKSSQRGASIGPYVVSSYLGKGAGQDCPETTAQIRVLPIFFNIEIWGCLALPGC